MNRIAGWILVLAAGTGIRANACSTNLPVRESRVNGQMLALEVATSESDRKCGLSGRESLPADHGMLFVLPWRMPVEFWMNDMKFPVAIAFLDKQGKIVDIQSMTPNHPTNIYRSPEPVWYVIETNLDWFTQHSIHVGDVFDIAFDAAREPSWGSQYTQLQTPAYATTFPSNN